MSSVPVMNPEDKMLYIYLQNLEKTVKCLCRIVNTLVSEGNFGVDSDQIVYEAYENVKQILGDIRYYQKFNNKQPFISKFISHTISVISSHSEHQPPIQTSKQEYLPPVKQSQTNKNLSTIAQKLSEQNLLHNYIKKQSQRKNISKYMKTNQGNSKTINEPVSYLNTSREFEIIREETRRSLDNSGMAHKKPLYKELEQMKGNQQMFPAVKDYLDKHNHKRHVISKNPNYTITKFI